MRISNLLAITLAASISSSTVFAQDWPGEFVDPAVIVTNQSSKAIEVMTYADVPHLKKIIKHEQTAQAGKTNTSKTGIDYYAKPNSGKLQDQRNKVVVSVYNKATGKLLDTESKTVNAYGSAAIKKDKHLLLQVNFSKNDQITLKLVNSKKSK